MSTVDERHPILRNVSNTTIVNSSKKWGYTHIGTMQKITVLFTIAVFLQSTAVTQLAERSLSISEISGLNPVIGKY